MRIYARNGMWYVETSLDGARKRLSTGVTASRPKIEAQAAAHDVVRRLLLTERCDAQVARAVGVALNLSEALERQLVHHWSRARDVRPMSLMVRKLEREIGHWLVREVDYSKLRNLSDGWLKDGLRPATVNRRMSALKVVLRECLNRGEIPGLPGFPRTLPEDNVRERYLSAEEEARVMEYLKRMSMAQLYTPDGGTDWSYLRLLVPFLIETGLRLSEALSLEDVRDNRIHLRSGTTKSGKARVVPLTPKAARIAPQLVQHPLHRKITLGKLQHYWGRVRRSCGVQDVNLHILRHTCASRLLAAGVDLYTVKEWLGHSSVKVTERYAHLEQGRLERAAELLANVPRAQPHLGTQSFRDGEESLTFGTPDGAKLLNLQGFDGAKGETRSSGDESDQ